MLTNQRIVEDDFEIAKCSDPENQNNVNLKNDVQLGQDYLIITKE